MADFNQLLASAFADFIRRRFGEDIDLSAIAPELIPVIALEVDRPEWLWLLGELPLGLAVLQALNAAQTSAVQIRNPSTPAAPILVMVDEVEFSASITSDVALCLQIISAGNMTNLAGSDVARDSRIGIPQGQAVLSSQNNVAAINILKRITQLANTPWVWRNVGVVLAPGSALQVVTLGNNVNLEASFSWRERRCRPEELQ